MPQEARDIVASDRRVHRRAVYGIKSTADA